MAIPATVVATWGEMPAFGGHGVGYRPQQPHYRTVRVHSTALAYRLPAARLPADDLLQAAEQLIHGRSALLTSALLSATHQSADHLRQHLLVLGLRKRIHDIS
jgi:hypothetical protein